MAAVEEEDRLAAAEAGNAGSAQGIASQKSAIKDALAAPTSSAAVSASAVTPTIAVAFPEQADWLKFACGVAQITVLDLLRMML